MEIEIINDLGRWRAMREIWDETLEQSPANHVCMTFEWFRAWWAAFGARHQLFVMVVKEKGKVIGIVPLMCGRTRYRGIPLRTIGFMANEHSACCDFIVERKRENVIEAAVEYLKRQCAWDIMVFENVPRYSPTHEILRSSFARYDMLSGVRDGLRSPYIDMAEDWDTFFAQRTKKFRKVLKNKINRIARLGNYTVSLYDTIEDEPGLLKRLAEISRNSWKARRHNALASRPETLCFFNDLSHRAGRKQWLRIWILTVNGMDIAYEYHLRRGATDYGLRADFNEEYRESSPGSVLDLHIVKHLFRDGCRKYDLCGSDDFYKMNWTTKVREHSKFMVFNSGLICRALHYFEFNVVSRLRRNSVLRRMKEAFTEGT